MLKATSLHSHCKTKLDVKIPDYHLSIKSTNKILSSIAHVIQLSLIEDIKSSQYIGIMVDESSDITIREILL